MFEATAARFADRVAVEVQATGGVDRFTYGELHALALDRAASLRAAGAQHGDRCAILAHNDAHWCAAYLGILACGAIVVPLDTNYSAAQVATILRDSGARVLFVDERLEGVAREAIASSSDIVVRNVRDAGAEAPALRTTPDGETEVPALRTMPDSETEAPALRTIPDAGAQSPALHADGRGSSWSAGASAPASSSPAVILYTSGTTADPKGVVLTDANLIAERDAAFAVVKVSEADSVLGVLPLFHSLAQLANLLLPFAVGARVVFLETLSSQELMRALAEREITVFACVPQFFNLIHERIAKEAARRGALAHALFKCLLGLGFRLRRIGINIGPLLFARVHRTLGRQMRFFVTGGSKFDPAIGRDFYAMGFTILQAYGLTETSGAATISGPDDAHIDTVGRPLPGVEVRILPPESVSNGTAEPGVTAESGANADGEIAIRGPIVTPGYYNRPDATAAALRDGWFLSGDLGRLDSHGRLTITGRKKDVIILANGKNLYPEEVEAHYKQSPFVSDICVTTVPTDDKPAGERLYAVVVPDMERLRERKIVNAGDLLRFELEGLSAHLPSYKRVLGYEIWFESLPRTTTGKLKRHEIEKRLREKRSVQELPPPSSSDDAWLEDPHVAAATEVVRASVPGNIRLAADANLELDLGLDSMERIELLTDLEQRFGVTIPAAEASGIFTLGQLVDAVRPDSPTGGAAIESGARSAEPAENREDSSWALLLRDLPPESDPVLGGLLARRPLVEPFVYALSRILRTMLARVEVSGLDHLPANGPYLICPNHQSYLDPIFVCGALPYRTLANTFFVGAVEYFDRPLTAWVARKINLVPVDPDSNLVPAMKASAFGLAHGKVLILFPEGERSIDGTVRKFKKGAAILSRHMEVPVVPVALKGVYEIWPRGRSFNWRVLLPWHRALVRLEIGPPVRFGEEETYAQFADQLRDLVDASWKRL
jgi:long-chain acyl-CoA synthetase